MGFASEKNAVGICDRCGFKYPLKSLKAEMYNRRPNGLRVCSDCLDVDHPQLRTDTLRTDDNVALQDPRPDTAEDASRSLSSWNPVGIGGLKMTGHVGQVKVITS